MKNNLRLEESYDIWISMKKKFGKDKFHLIEKIFSGLIDKIDNDAKKRYSTPD